MNNIQNYIKKQTTDAVLWFADMQWQSSATTAGQSDAIQQIVELLVCIKSDITRDAYVKSVSEYLTTKNQKLQDECSAINKSISLLQKRADKTTDQAAKTDLLQELEELGEKESSIKARILPALPAKDLKKYVTDFIKESAAKQKEERVMDDYEEGLPEWVNAEQLYTEGFVMNNDPKKAKIGIYYKASPVERLTNYVVNPLFFVMDPTNSRRLIEAYNGRKNVVVELPNRAFTQQDTFETELVSRGAFYSEPGFAKPHFKRLVNWLSDSMLNVHSLNTLGWQPEGFFAFSNMALSCTTELMEAKPYDEYGIVHIDDKAYLSEGASKLNADTRAEDNMYENDMYLQYIESKVTFAEWAELFYKVYNEDAMFGIAFIFIAAFKDIITKIAKCPHLYCYGPKGSGKSEFAESLMFFFFSGKNSDGKLIQGYNLAPGNGTPFSFNSRMARFRNVLMLFNEYDPNTIEFWKKGAFKSMYDGEGREVGAGDSGKKRKTVMQKTNCVAIMAGQYLDTTDDGAVLSRSVPIAFSLEKNKKRNDTDKLHFEQLKDLEKAGLSGIVAEIYACRSKVMRELKAAYTTIGAELNHELKIEGKLVEPRIKNNYSLVISMAQVMSKQLKLPFDMEQMKQLGKKRMVSQNELLRNNNALNSFWRVVETLFDDGHIESKVHFKIANTKSIFIQKGSTKDNIEWHEKKCVLYIRFNTIYEKFAKRYNEVYKKSAPDQDTLLVYLHDQHYFIGLCPATSFKDKKTSAYMLYYETLKAEMNLELEKGNSIELNADMDSENGNVLVNKSGEELFSSNKDDMPF